MEGEDYKLGDVGSLAKKIPSDKWSFWKKTIVFISIGVLVILLLIIILVAISNSTSKKSEEDGIDESKVTANISCLFDIDQISEKTGILGKDFVKPNKFNILLDKKKIGFFREYEFSEPGQHILSFLFYDRSINLDNMFTGIKSLLSADINSTKNVSITSMKSTFEDCEYLDTFTIHGCNLNNLKSVQRLFYGTNNLEHLSLNFLSNIENIEDMSYLFAMSKLSSIDLTTLNTKKVKNMSHMFYGCGSLKSLDFTNLDTSLVEDMSYMFSNCDSLSQLIFGDFKTNNVKNMSHMFSDCISLKQLEVSGFKKSKICHICLIVVVFYLV